MFPAYYNPGAIFDGDIIEREKLETDICRRTYLNWTYELARVLRTGGFYIDGDHADSCYWYDGTLVDANSKNANIDEQRRDFFRRTGYSLPCATYAESIINKHQRVAIPYYARRSDNEYGMDSDLRDVMKCCRDVLTDMSLTNNVKVSGPLGNFCDTIAGRREATQFRPVLAAYPTHDLLGCPAHNPSTNELISGVTPVPWTIANVLDRGFFTEIFRRDCGKNGNEHGICFVAGQVVLDKEGEGDHIGRYYRFICVARTTLRWSADEMYGVDFLNATKRTRWYVNGLHHHARIFVFSKYDLDNEFYFDLSLGNKNRRDQMKSPEFLGAHALVDKLLADANTGCEFCSYVYVGYDVVQGG
ncbi:MAG: hypothetical protein IT367_20355 [Candidatus Hydrogenedentes bacterium]|nr:hypothetical protein [Candidatus Hydrogenedentota bacterium]